MQDAWKKYQGRRPFAFTPNGSDEQQIWRNGMKYAILVFENRAFYDKILPSLPDCMGNGERNTRPNRLSRNLSYKHKRRKEVKKMQLVEKYVIDRSDPRHGVIDEAAFKSKNLYNAANYEVRQSYIHTGKYLNYHEMDRRMQSHEAYKALPAKVAQQVLMQLHHDWDAFFKARAAYAEDSSKFRARPKIPGYKHKTQGRNMLVYTDQAISRGKRGLKRGIIKPSMLEIEVQTKQKHINQVRIVPRKGFYVVEAVYEQEVSRASVNPVYYAGIDLGMNNLVALTSNKPGFRSVLVNGRPVKSMNQYYNKRRAELQKQFGHTGTTKRMERMTNKRNRRIDHYMHTASKRIIDLLVQEGIGTLVIGKNDGWKQEVNMGKRTNQNFVQIPHARFIAMLTYKAELAGITVRLAEESYTSRASLLDLDPLPVHGNSHEKHTFSGKRIKRGLYRASDGRYINADCNGSGNILRKVAPDAFSEARAVEDGKGVLSSLVVHPVRLVIAPSRTQKEKSKAMRENARKR
jgi:putative transposase